jgi:UrcA family protein
MYYTNIISICGAVAVTAAGLVLVAPPSSAKAPVVVTAPRGTVVRHISYADLNLASLAGERTLNHRVRGAVRSLCLEATGGDNGSFEFKYTNMRCDNRAWSEASPQISRAVQRAHDIASTGTSPIAAVAITIALPK